MLLSILLALACLAWPGQSHAQGRRLLVLLGPQEPVFWPWLRAELGSSGFDVLTARASTSPPGPAEIEQAAARASTSIGLSPLEDGAGIAIWLVDPATRRLVFRELILGLYRPEETPDVVAVRMVETLRATLMELEQQRSTAERWQAAANPPPAAKEPTPSRFHLGVGGGGAFSPGGVGAIGFLQLSLGYALSSRFSLVIDGAFTPVASRLEGDEGAADLAWTWVGAALSFRVTDPKAALGVRSGVGAWLSLLATTGQATAPFEDRQTTSLSVIPHVDLGLRWSLSERLGLGADASAGLSTPRTAIDFAGRERATWGQPLWLGRLSLETSLD